jgi:hypothetical protein
MYNKLFTCLIVLLSFTAHSQIKFEKGYFIDNNDKKIDCLIKNLDWRNSPSEIQYKLDEQDQPITISTQQLKVFAIENESKYERFNIDIDQSTQTIDDLGYDRNPEFKKENILLKVLVEGKATLFEYSKDNKTFFFFKTDTIPANQLIYKPYKVSEQQISENNFYKQQLARALKCDQITNDQLVRLKYERNALIKIFKSYNTSQDSEFSSFKPERKKDLLNIAIRPGITSNKLSITNDAASYYNTKFNNQIGFRLGVEAEFILPFNKNKWAIVIEPTYQIYKSEKTRNNGLSSQIDYNTIEFPIGFRHNMFLGNDSKLFINAQYVFEKAINSKGLFEDRYGNNEIEIKPRNSTVFGLGYNYKKKYSVEARINLPKEILGSYVFWESNYQSVSLVFGYSIF